MQKAVCIRGKTGTFFCVLYQMAVKKRSSRSPVMIGSVPDEDGVHPGQRWRTSRPDKKTAQLKD